MRLDPQQTAPQAHGKTGSSSRPSAASLLGRGDSPVSASGPERPPSREFDAEEILSRLEGSVDWQALEPRGFYPSLVRPMGELALLAILLLPSIVFGVPIVLVNWIVFRDVRKILFLQPRVGHRGRVFVIYKYRTMRDARSGARGPSTQSDEVLRVTAFGRFLRNTHLDELPQVINILRGEMNVIGPRPEMLEIEAWAACHVSGFATRLALKPGITGLAQIQQGYTPREVEAYATKLRINDEYRRHVSFSGDIAIVFRTALWMLRGRGWRLQRKQGPARDARG